MEHAMEASTTNTSSKPDHDDLYTAVLKMPSCFGRLLYVASLALSLAQNNRDNPGVDDLRRRQEVRKAHLATFENWLSLSLPEKQADFKLCAASEGHSAEGLLLSLARPEKQRELLPSCALSTQRDLFALELEVLFLIV